MKKKLALLLIMFLMVLLALNSTQNITVSKAAGVDAPLAMLAPPSVFVPAHLSGTQFFRWKIEMPLADPDHWNVEVDGTTTIVPFQGNLHVEKGDVIGGTTTISDFRDVPINCSISLSDPGTGGTIIPPASSDPDPMATFDGNAFLNCDLPSIMDIAGFTGIPGVIPPITGLEYDYPIHDYEDFRDKSGESNANLLVEFQAFSNNPGGGTIFEHPSMELLQDSVTDYSAEVYDDLGISGNTYFATMHHSSSSTSLASPITAFGLKVEGVGWGDDDVITYDDRSGKNFAWCMNAVPLTIGRGFTGKLGNLFIDPRTSQSTGSVSSLQSPTPTSTIVTPTATFIKPTNCTQTARSSITVTPTATPTYTLTPTETFTATITKTKSRTPTITKTKSLTPTKTGSKPKTFTPTITKTKTVTPIITKTKTFTPTKTGSKTKTLTPTKTKTITRTPMMTRTATATAVHIPSCDIQITLPRIHYLNPPVDTVISTYTVNSFDDTVDSTPGDNFCSDASGHCTLRAAVMEANEHSGTDKILLPPGPYNMTRAGAGEDHAETGDYDILGSVFIESTAATKAPLLTKIDAQHLDRVFHVITGTLTIDNLTIQKGTVGTADWGGNMLVSQAGGLRASSLIIQDGKGGSGGGVYFYKATAAAAKTNFIRSTILQNNEATGWAGGGVFVEQSIVKMIDSHIISNKANLPDTKSGWAAGGGMYITSGSTVTVHGSIMAYNETASNGGGIYNNGTLTINRSLLLKNKAAGAAGALIVDNGGTGNITNTTIACNQATKFGNITLDGTTGLSVLNSTIVYNVAGWGSAVTEKVQVGNSILWGNRNTSNLLDNCPFVSLGYNIVDSPFCLGTNHLFTNSNFGPLTIYAYTLVYPLLPGSPAIDTASDANCLLLPTPRVDQRGVVRPQGVRCDRGAFEFIP